MAKSENQKVKTLYVAKYFLENSDENHAVTAGDVVDYLKNECGIEAERRAIYRDIAALRAAAGRVRPCGKVHIRPASERFGGHAGRVLQHLSGRAASTGSVLM